MDNQWFIDTNVIVGYAIPMKLLDNVICNFASLNNRNLVFNDEDECHQYTRDVGYKYLIQVYFPPLPIGYNIFQHHRCCPDITGHIYIGECLMEGIGRYSIWDDAAGNLSVLFAKINAAKQTISQDIALTKWMNEVLHTIPEIEARFIPTACDDCL